MFHLYKSFQICDTNIFTLQKKLFIKLQIMSESNSNPHIYDKFRSSDKQIDFLMSDKGQSYLDAQIMKMMKDMDAQQLIEFTTQFFKFGQNQCSSLQAMVTNELTSRINLEGGCANVPQTQNEKNKRQEVVRQVKNSRNERKNVPSKINLSLPEIMKQMNVIRETLEGSGGNQPQNQEELNQNEKDEDKINFEQFRIDEYNPQLGTDDDYLNDDANDCYLTQAENNNTRKDNTNVLQKQSQDPQQPHQPQHPPSAYQTTIQQDSQQQFDQLQRIPLQQNRYKITYNNGDSYEGQLQNQMKNGWGEYYYSTGQKYSGNFFDDEIHGYGRYYFLSGAEYQGDWSSGLKHGVGILKFASGDVYEGGFVNDLFHGKGTYKSVNGDLFKGVWKNGMKHGKGTFEGADGSIQIGQWVNDKFEV